MRLRLKEEESGRRRVKRDDQETERERGMRATTSRDRSDEKKQRTGAVGTEKERGWVGELRCYLETKRSGEEAREVTGR